MGLNIFAGHPLIANPLLETTGEVFFVGNTVAAPGGVAGTDSAGSGGRSATRPFATIDYAIGQCVAGRGDRIIVLPGHTETVTAAITLDVAGVGIFGLGVGRNRPTITPSGAIDAINVTAANCFIHNIRVAGAAADVTASVNIASGGTDFSAFKCVFEQAETPLAAWTINAARWSAIDCQFVGAAGCAADNAFLIEATGCNNWRVKNCTFDYGVNGLDEAVIESDFKTVGGEMDNCTVIGMDTLLVDFNSSTSAQGDGIISNVRCVAGAGIADIDTAADVGGYSLIQCFLSDTAAESGGRFPVTTPA